MFIGKRQDSSGTLFSQRYGSVGGSDGNFVNRTAIEGRKKGGRPWKFYSGYFWFLLPLQPCVLYLVVMFDRLIGGGCDAD